jgi:hypothetical protein
MEERELRSVQSKEAMEGWAVDLKAHYEGVLQDIDVEHCRINIRSSSAWRHRDEDTITDHADFNYLI